MILRENTEEEIPLLENYDDVPDPTGSSSDQELKDPFDPTKIQIISKQESLYNLIERLRNNEIDLNPDFQRHADLWSSQAMSRLIESILIRFPLPSFYFDASDENNWLVIDGLQRLSSIKKFVIEKDPKKQLTLRGLEYLKEFEEKTYDELPRSYKRRIDESVVTLLLIQPGTPDMVKYSIFRRINTGGLILNNQEIRNALADAKERLFLEDLVKDEYLVKTMGNQSKRMLDQELALRFISFYRLDYEKNRRNIAGFMDEAMTLIKKASSSELEELKQHFHRTLEICYKIFGPSAFEKNVQGDASKRKRKNTTLFEVWTVCIAQTPDEITEKLIQNRSLLVEKLQELVFKNEDFFRAISMATQKKDHVRIRYAYIQKLIHEVALA